MAEFLGFTCPKCGSPMRPMKSNKGYNCAAPGNRYLGAGAWSVCDGVRWNRGGGSAFVAKKPVERPAEFPVIENPTEEQKEMFRLMGTNPAQRGGRCLIYDAGPGTAKTTSMAAGMIRVYNRLKSLHNYRICAFNVNAAEVLQTKIPAVVPDISTLNSAGGRAQGYNRRNYDKGKSWRLFNGLVSHIEPKERPNYGAIGKVLERSRDCCLWTTPDDRNGWMDIISTVMVRFPSLAKRSKGQEAKILDWLPSLASATLAEKSKIDLQEQLTRPVTVAMARTGWRMNCELVNKKAGDWTDENVAHFAELIKAIDLPNVAGLVVDEAQDLSLAQIAVVLAQTYRTGELMLIGDDMAGIPGQPGYKAGQAIYGWRGAFGGSLTLIARLWEALTGETAIRKNLTVTFRHSEEYCAAYRPLNTIIRSAKPNGYSAAYTVGGASAFEAWLVLPPENTALWITRTNAAIVPIFLGTLTECADCTIRGGADFSSSVDAALYEAAGVPNESGEYRVTLPACIAKLQEIVNGDDGEIQDPNSMESFMLGIAEAIQANPEMLEKAQLFDKALTVGNLRRFVLFFADRNSRRVLTTVYRCKGDEADLAIVADTTKFNESWGDEMEDNACRHVAASRGKKLVLFVGHLTGTIANRADEAELMATLPPTV